MTLSEGSLQLIKTIEEGNYFKSEIELSVDPSLIHTREPSSGNNLLHLCVLNNRPDIFEMVLRKCQQFKWDLLAEKNKVVLL